MTDTDEPDNVTPNDPSLALLIEQRSSYVFALAHARCCAKWFQSSFEIVTRLPILGIIIRSSFQFDVFPPSPRCFSINQIRCPKIDPSKLDRENLRAILERSDSNDHEELSGRSEWSGVSVDSDDRIIVLNVTNRNLSGELPAALFEISNLEYLHATSNLFTG